MTDKTLSLDNKIHELTLGESFDKNSGVAFHSIRYDFKPASVDTTKESAVEILEGHQVTVAVPHVDGSGTAQTVYKGNKRPCPKECVLVIDHKTGSFTLEKLTNVIQLKKTRPDGSSRAGQSARPLTPVDFSKPKHSPPKPKANQRSSNTPSPTPATICQPEGTSAQSPTIPTQKGSPSVPVHIDTERDNEEPVGEISDDSSSSDSDSDTSSSDSEDDSKKVLQNMNINSSMPSFPATSTPVVNSRPILQTTLSQDLELSESDSD